MYLVHLLCAACGIKFTQTSDNSPRTKLCDKCRTGK